MNARIIGNKLGEVLEVDTAVDSESNSCDFMRVKVVLDVRLPFSPGFYFRPDLSTMLWVAFKYECLSGLCYKCGMIDHLMNSCEPKLPHPYHDDLGPGMKVSAVTQPAPEKQRAAAPGVFSRSSSASVALLQQGRITSTPGPSPSHVQGKQVLSESPGKNMGESEPES